MNRKTSSDDPTPGAPVGKVRRDAQGNAVWEWAAATGRHALDSTSRLLRKLEVPGLKLLDDEGAAKPDQSGSPSQPSAPLPKGTARNKVQGYDPYGGQGATPVSRTAAPSGARANAKTKPSFLSRLFGRR